MHMVPRRKDKTARKIKVIMKCSMSRIYKTLLKWLLVWVSLTDMLGDKSIDWKAYIVELNLAKKC